MKIKANINERAKNTIKPTDKTDYTKRRNQRYKLSIPTGNRMEENSHYLQYRKLIKNSLKKMKINVYNKCVINQ